VFVGHCIFNYTGIYLWIPVVGPENVVNLNVFIDH